MLNRVAKHKKILAIIAVVIFICEFFLLYLAWGNYTVRKDKEWEIKNSEYFSQTCERLDNTISTVKSLAQILFQEDSIQRYANDRFYNYEGSLICRVLKDEYNTTFKECINRKRIAESCKIIEQNPNIKVEELAETVGYNNTKTFARVFKKYKGVVPSEYMQL